MSSGDSPVGFDPRLRPLWAQRARARDRVRKALFGDIPGPETGPVRSAATTRVNESPGSEPGPSRGSSAIARGSALGRYLVLGTLGRGGMGTVFKAYDEALNRAVAIKLLRSGTTERHAQRLRREAQALAKLSHPNVVHVYEVGQTHGQWFIAMELVLGRTLRRWQAKRRSWRECVEVYLQAGQGLGAAHAAGLVHRDFKPDNCIIDEQGRVRVLDFGLVRDDVSSSEDHTPVGFEDETRTEGAVREREPEDALLTRTGTVLGTVAYMPPEQHDGRRADARSDQFSFCVSLYEAIYGERPFAGASMAALLDEVRSGSVRPAPLGRAAVPSALRSVLIRGLAAAPDARWPSMDALLGELRRRVAPRRRGMTLGVMLGLVAVGGGVAVGQYAQVMDRCTGARAQLDGVWDEQRREQLETAILGTQRSYAPETWVRVEQRLDDYAQQWVSRHTSICEATRATQEQTEADMGLRMGCLRERKIAFEAAVDVLAEPPPGPQTDPLESAVKLVAGLPGFERCDDLRALRSALPPPEDPVAARQVQGLRERLAELAARQQAGRRVSEDDMAPLLQQAEALGYGPLLAEVMARRGWLRDSDGRYPEAEQDLLAAYALAVEHRHEEVARDAARDLIWVLGLRQARHDEGLMWGQIALAHVGRDGEDLAPEHEALVLERIGTVLDAAGDLDEALSHQQRALAIVEAAPGEHLLAIISSLDHIGISLARQGKLAQARDYQQRALAAMEQALGQQHPHVAKLLNNMAIVLRMQGELDHALKLQQRALSIAERAWGADHPNVAPMLDNLGAVLATEGELQDAAAYFRRALVLRERVLGPEHPDLASSLGNIGTVLSDQGELEESLVYFGRALTIKQEALGEDHADVGALLNNMGMVLHEQGKLDEALAHHQRALGIFERAVGPEHPDLAGSLNNIGKVMVDQGRLGEALDHFQRALAIKQQALGPSHPRVAASLNAIGGALRRQGKLEQAREYHQRALDAWRESLGEEHSELSHAELGLAMVSLEQRDLDAARTHAERAVSLREAGEYSAVGVAEARFLLARCSWSRRADRARARALAQQARASFAEHGSRYDAQLAEIEQWLAEHPAP